MPKRKAKPRTFFESLEQGLSEALAYAEGNPKPGTRAIVLKEAKPRSATQIRKLRRSLGKTQAEFATLLSVSVKTIEAWEAGTKKPTGPALRFFELMETYSFRLGDDGRLDLKRIS
jgi:putative transcriptional regulator